MLSVFLFDSRRAVPCNSSAKLQFFCKPDAINLQNCNYSLQI